MPSYSTGSNIFFAFALFAIAILVLALLRHYVPLRATPAYLLLPVFLSIALPASIILLVPVDLSSSAVSEDGSARGIWLPEGVLLVFWKISYWLTFVLTWAILPVLGEYADAGQRDPREKMIYSLRSNGQFYLIGIATSVVGLIYFFFTSGFGTTSLKAFVMALAYGFGLVMAIYLMGHGLVSIPRQLYKNASTSRRLHQLRIRAPRVHERFTEAVEDLAQLESQVIQMHQRRMGTAMEFQDWIEELMDGSGMPESQVSQSAQSAKNAVPHVITERYLSDLTRKLKRARHKRARFVEEWARLVREAKGCQDILDAAGPRALDPNKGPISWAEKALRMTPAMRYQLHTRILPALRMVFSVVFAIASMCIIWSELFKAGLPGLSIVGISIIHYPKSDDGKIGFGGQVMSAFWLLYMCAASFISVTEVKIWGNRALVTRNTYAESACFYASIVARLTVPLAYNFLTLVPPKISEKTAFYQFFGRLIDLTPLGEGFSKFFPIFILVPVLATLFNLYSRVKNFAGFGAFEDDAEENPSGYGSGNWREGRALIDREVLGTHDLGLSSRDHSPRAPLARLQIPQQTANNNLLSPVSPTGNAPSSSVLTAEAAVSSPTGRQRLPAQPPPQYRDNADAGEANIFEDFAHRVRNTFDSAETPEWIANLPRPKWMGGADDRNRASGSPSTNTRGFGRIFGGKSDGDGRLRLQ